MHHSACLARLWRLSLLALVLVSLTSGYTLPVRADIAARQPRQLDASTSRPEVTSSPPAPAAVAGSRTVAWGSRSGQLGPGRTYDSLQVAAGGNRSMALKVDGTVEDWGQHSSGQTHAPPDLADAIQVAAGMFHSVALRADGSVAVWGTNTYQSLNTPAGLIDLAQIAAGAAHTVALRDDGTVVAWGSNAFLQTDIPAGLNDVVQVGAGGSHSFAIKADGSLAAWGWNSMGQASVPAGLTDVAQVDGGVLHSLALKEDGTVVAWGDNMVGQASVPPGLANVVQITAGDMFSAALTGDGSVVVWGGSAEVRAVPPGLANVVQIAAGADHMLALLPDGAIVAWGANRYGQATVASGVQSAVQVDAGYSYNLALMPDGTVTGWGANTYGQLNIPAGLTDVIQIAAGGPHALALKEDGTVVGWGTGSQAVVPAGLSQVVQIAAGNAHSLALKQDGTVVGWGNNTNGALDIPPGLSNVVQIAASDAHNVALKDDGTVVEWGYLGGLIPRPADLTGVVEVEAGYFSTFAIKSDGTLAAWGGSPYHDADVPAGLTNVAHVSAAAFQVAALKHDGTLVMWGTDNNGELDMPTNLANVVQVTAGYSHTLALVGSPAAPELRAPAAMTLAEGTSGAAQLQIGDPDTPATSLTITAVSSNQALVPDSQLTLSGTGISRTLSFTPVAHANGSATITLIASDGERSASASLVLTYTPVNSPPTAIALSSSAVLEGQPAGTPVGTLSASDPDGGPGFAYTLASGAGDDHNSLFSIVGDQLRTAAVFDAAAQASYTIRVQVDDGQGGVFAQALAISVVADLLAPSFTSPAPPGGSYGQPYAHSFVAAGEPESSYAITGGSLPPGLALNPETGALTGTPAQAGVFGPITVTASNGVAPDATQTFSLAVAKAPLTIVAHSFEVAAGAALPELTFDISGLVNGDTGATALAGALTTTASPGGSPGSYPITQGTLRASNYVISFTAGTLSIQAAPSFRVSLPLIQRPAGD